MQKQLNVRMVYFPYDNQILSQDPLLKKIKIWNTTSVVLCHGMEFGWFAWTDSFRRVWNVVFHGLFLSFGFFWFSFVSAVVHDKSIIPNMVCRVKGCQCIV